jgi:hypothetical protein
VALVDSVSPHLSNVDVLSLKRKELREYILVPPVFTLRLFLSLTCILLVTCLLACLSLIGNSPSCTSSEFTLCQALKLKKIKNYLSAYSPPLVARIDPFSIKDEDETFYQCQNHQWSQQLYQAWRKTRTRIEGTQFPNPRT